MLTEQMLRRSPALAVLNPVAAAHHEKADGSGYHKGMRNDAAGAAPCVFTAADVYVGLTTERADRAAFSAGDAAEEMRRLASQGVLDHRATQAVLAAAGHDVPRGGKSAREQQAGGLSDREVQVLHLASKGLTTKQIADRLFISPKTADHHIQHVYTKIGVKTRAAAALWAMSNAVV